MTDRSSRLATWVVVVLLVGLAGGCSGWSGGGPRLPTVVVEPASSYDKKLRKKIAIVPFENKSIFGGPALGTYLQDNLLQALGGECDQNLFLAPGGGGLPDALRDLPLLANGAIDNFTLATTARRFGVNAALVGKVISINVDQEMQGLPFFRGTQYFVQVEVLLELYDTGTATKLFDRTLMHRLDIEETDAELIRAQNRIDPSFVQPSLNEIVDDVFEEICAAIKRQAWKSYILAVAPDEILIAAGRQSNVRAGDVFAVHGNRPLIEGYGGHLYIPRGPKIGEIEVQSVADDTARAAPVSGDGFEEGQGLRLKE